MATLNKVMLIGNITRDPEIKYTPKGSAVTDIGLALNRVFTMENGEKREETTFVDVTLWGKQAEFAGEYLHKGRSVFIEGRLQMDTWEDKQSGQKRSRLRIVADGIQPLGPRPGGGSGGGECGSGGYTNTGSHESAGGGGGGGKSYPSKREPSSHSAPPAQEVDNDDIPF
ncbi:MAG: single-stranded DNA-binding protein [Chthoniobacterales bacterium]